MISSRVGANETQVKRIKVIKGGGKGMQCKAREERRRNILQNKTGNRLESLKKWQRITLSPPQTQV